ncbi:helix-turn-helix transcriptional regulator [Georgenia daeguensis]|uniref:HTH cro/C1-type domain-containing protein n=1 Tax=Georgenia daeguensis TaxID=908355 RepID=A0ABP6UL69_9MICO
MADHVTMTRPSRRHLWRNIVGAYLRAVRRRRGETLTEVGARAGVSPQYLSEIERGRKEPSSEVLAAVVDALGLTLSDVTRGVTLALESGTDRRLVKLASEARHERADRHAGTTVRPHGDVLLLAA